MLPASAVEESSVGEDAVVHLRVTTGGRTRDHYQRATEPVPGRVLREADIGRDRAITFTATPKGDRICVRIETNWRRSAIRSRAARRG